MCNLNPLMLQMLRNASGQWMTFSLKEYKVKRIYAKKKELKWIEGTTSHKNKNKHKNILSVQLASYLHIVKFSSSVEPNLVFMFSIWVG